MRNFTPNETTAGAPLSRATSEKMAGRSAPVAGPRTYATNKTTGHRVTIKRPGEASAKGKRILIITPSYPPYTNPRAFRWSAIAEQWAGEGAEVRVIAGWTPGAVKREHSSGVDIVRVGGGIIERLRSGLRKSGRETVAVARHTSRHQSRSSTLKSITRHIARVANDLIWKQVYWPDYACLWIPSAVIAANRALKESKFDSIVTVSDPFSAQIVGVIIKRLHPAINWTVDIGDPFCFRHDTPTNNHTLYRSLNYRVERNVFSNANSVTVTTEATAKKYQKLFPESADKIHVIGPMAPTRRATEERKRSRSSGAKRMVFVGSLYRNIRNPHFLLNLFERLLQDNRFENWELHFYGGYDGCQSYFEPYRDVVGKRIVLHGLSSRKTALQALADADVLVNIGNDNVYQLPSKVMEYVAYGKPILHVSGIDTDCSTEFFRKHNLALCLHSETGVPDDGQSEKLKSFLTKPSSCVSSNEVSQLIAESNAPSIAAKYSIVVRAGAEKQRAYSGVDKKPTWHCYYATRGAAGAYVDALLKASHTAGVNAEAFVSANYEYSTKGAIQVFFPFTDRLNNRGAVLRVLRGIELIAAYMLICAKAVIRRPRIVIHLVDDLRTTGVFFKLCRLFGLETWLTCHDVRSHYLGANSRRRHMMQSADGLIVHNTAAYNELIEILGEEFARKVKRYPFPFSSYDDILTPAGLAQAERSLAKLIPGGPGFYLFLGVVRNSKGIRTLIDAWTTMNRPADQRLVVAGVWTDPSPEVRSQAESDESITVIDRYLTDSEFVELIAQARFTVLPYDDYAHSSVVMSCANHGGAVITSDIPLFTEFAPRSEWVFERGDAAALRKLLLKSFAADNTEVQKAKSTLKDAMERQNRALVDEVSGVFRGVTE